MPPPAPVELPAPQPPIVSQLESRPSRRETRSESAKSGSPGRPPCGFSAAVRRPRAVSFCLAARSAAKNGKLAAAASAHATVHAPKARNRRKSNRRFSCGDRSGRVYLETPVANALVIGRGVLVHQRAFPDRFQIGRQLQLVHVTLIERAQLAADLLLHLVFNFGARNE